MLHCPSHALAVAVVVAARTNSVNIVRWAPRYAFRVCGVRVDDGATGDWSTLSYITIRRPKLPPPIVSRVTDTSLRLSWLHLRPRLQPQESDETRLLRESRLTLVADDAGSGSDDGSSIHEEGSAFTQNSGEEEDSLASVVSEDIEAMARSAALTMHTTRARVVVTGGDGAVRQAQPGACPRTRSSVVNLRSRRVVEQALGDSDAESVQTEHGGSVDGQVPAAHRWSRHFDPGSTRFYFYNSTSRKSAWHIPEGHVVIEQHNAPSKARFALQAGEASRDD